MEEEQRLTTLLADQIMLKVYGDDTVQKTTPRSATKTATANYPFSYQDESRHFDCRNIASTNKLERTDTKERESKPFLKPIPAYCAKYMEAKSGKVAGETRRNLKPHNPFRCCAHCI